MFKKIFVASFALTLIFSCSKNQPATNQFVRSVNVTTLDKKASVAPDKTSSRSVEVRAVLDKKAILSQDYFYLGNLQYSSIYDKKFDLYTQSSASGLVPVHFRIVGNELDLIADNRNQYPSDVNHPEQLITRFKIIEQNDTSLTVSQGDSSHYLAADLVTGGATAGATAEDHWVRSFEFSPQGQYLLQESSVLLTTGEIGEFMESIFPKENMKASANFKVYQMNPDEAAGATEGVLARYRFLQTDKIFNGETKLAYAEHFDLANDQATIDWYVTPNIPDEDLEPVGLAVDAWNRYFKNFKGINRNVMNFKGRLPDGVHLGDPRYNVINWDSRLVAGAAYESQSFDPANGKQANSIIYMPAAWIKIGMDYWASGEFSDLGDAQASAQSGATKSRSVCYRDLHEAAAYLASGKIRAGSEEDLKKFGIELLKQTLFHELGHSLGLDHNFKASLVYKPTDTKPTFSTSIMDYNDFEIERAAFDDIHSSTGPQLEYDRQALSVLYNNAGDIATSDPVLPTCNDKEADNEAGGVDPLCTRYDIQSDPTQSIVDAAKKINQASMDHEITLSDAILQVPTTILSATALANVKTKADFDQISLKISTALDGVLNYYYSTGRSSLGYATKINLKSLYKFNNKLLPADFDPRLMRERVYSGVTQVLSTKTLSDGVAAALAKSIDKSLDTLKLAPYITGISSTDANQIFVDKQKLMSAHVANFAKDEKQGLPAMRTKILTAMARHPGVPFFFGKFDKTIVDYEMMTISLLSDATFAKDRMATERLAAAKSLASFSGRKLGDDALGKVNANITAERDAAEDSDTRDLAESLLKALSGAASATSLK